MAADVGLDFRHGAFRFGMSFDSTAMMGGGLCWLDYDRDGWLDLFVVNSYAQADASAWEARGGLPRSALYRNVRGRFEDVSAAAGADLPLRGNGCVAADFDLDGNTDLYVTTAGYNVATDGYDALLWNDGDGSFTEGAQAAGINAMGWHAGAAVGDVDGDGLPDLFVSGYTDPNWPIPASAAGFPTNHHAERDLLYLNQGRGENGRPTFREVERPPASSRSGSATGSEPCSPTSTVTVGSTCTSRTMPTRTSCTRTSPRRRAGLPLRGGGAARGRRRPERRDGDRSRRLQPATALPTSS